MKSGLSGLRVLKTTQSAFVDFVQDEYTTLTDAAERIFRYLLNFLSIKVLFFSNLYIKISFDFWPIFFFSIVNLNSSNSTVVEAEWIYDNMRTADFDNAWLTVKDAILDKFAGPADIGVYSPSVQHTLYQAEKTVLEKVPEVSSANLLFSY